MCLFNDRIVLNQLRFNKPDKILKGYKIVDLRGWPFPWSSEHQYIVSPYQNYKWHEGENLARPTENFDTPTKCYNIRRSRKVKAGIHVYRNKRTALRKALRMQRKLMIVTGKVSDLIGANKSEMVFTKVNLAADEHNRIIN